MSHLFRVVIRWERGVVALLNLFTQRVQVHLVPIEWTLKSSHLTVREGKAVSFHKNHTEYLQWVCWGQSSRSMLPIHLIFVATLSCLIRIMQSEWITKTHWLTKSYKFQLIRSKKIQTHPTKQNKNSKLVINISASSVKFKKQTLINACAFLLLVSPFAFSGLSSLIVKSMLISTGWG